MPEMETAGGERERAPGRSCCSEPHSSKQGPSTLKYHGTRPERYPPLQETFLACHLAVESAPSSVSGIPELTDLASLAPYQ